MIERAMIRRFVVSAVVILVLASLTACRSGTGTTVASSAENDPPLITSREVTEPDSGKLLILPVGETFQISLEANATAGYQWLFRQHDETLLPCLERTFTLYSDQPGSAGIARWEFHAQAVGETRVVLVLCRPWECEDSAVREFELGVRIRPSATDAP